MKATCNFCNKELPVVAEHGRKYACRKCHEKIAAGKEKAKKAAGAMPEFLADLFGFKK